MLRRVTLVARGRELVAQETGETAFRMLQGQLRTYCDFQLAEEEIIPLFLEVHHWVKEGVFMPTRVTILDRAKAEPKRPGRD